MRLDDQPYCGAELLPHATSPDGSPAPVLCTRPVHGRDLRHHGEKPEMYWQWQDSGGNWLHGLRA